MLSSRAARRQGAAHRSASYAKTRHNGIDAFGTLRLPGDHVGERVRLVEYGDGRFAAFSAAEPTAPVLLEVAEYQVKGRLLRGTLADGAEFAFQKAGCGCETPRELRGPRGRLLEEAGL